MELKLMKKSAAIVEERKADEDSINDDGGGKTTEKVVGAKPLYSGDTSKTSSSPKQADQNINNKEDQLEFTKAAMCEVREENERLKTILAQIMKDYQSLQMHFFDIMKQEQANKKTEEGEPSFPSHKECQLVHEEHELVSLSLGSGSRTKKQQEEKTSINERTVEDLNDYHIIKEGRLTLGLDSKMEEREFDLKNEVQLSMSTENSSQETAVKEETATGETWPPSKALKSLKRGEEEVAPQAQVKRARVSVRARCDAPTMNDGCQWRKYGQKIAKGNPCPRAYYRCTVAPGCPVRKQVQRCADDMSILITTYEGNHNHPLPISATAMASTTAAAASMLTSGSSSSLPAAAPPHSTANAAAGLNFSLPDSSNYQSRHQFYLTNPSISPSPSQPTITLDLTNPSAAAGNPNRFSSSSSSRSFNSPASFSFLPSESPSWGSSTGYFSYGSHQPYYKSYNMGALRQSQESLFHSYAQKSVQNPITDTIAKAITSDPSFQSALAAAITSYVGGSTPITGEAVSGGVGDAVLKWGEQLQLASSLTTTTTAMQMGGSGSSSSSKGSLVFLTPTVGSSSTKNGTNGSPRNNS